MGRIRAEDEDLATVPFLASDNEEEDDDKTATGRYGEYRNKYFVVVLSNASYLKECVRCCILSMVKLRFSPVLARTRDLTMQVSTLTISFHIFIV